MSATDLAFIRAYSEPGSPAAAHLARTRTNAQIEGGATSVADATPSMANIRDFQSNAPVYPAALQNRETKVGQTTTTRTTSVHVGLGSVVPAPHANFALKSPMPAGSAYPQPGGPAVASLSAALNQSTARPLSAFGNQFAAGGTASATPRPALEIDSVRWPDVCLNLLGKCSERFDCLAMELRQEIAAGNRTLAITGVDRREGRTTLALCLAQRLAAANIKLVLIDADFANPRMARQLGIGIHRGWETAITGEESPWDVMIESITDRITILPLAAPMTTEEISIGSYRIAATVAELAEHYDLVLLDTGAIDVDPSAAPHWMLDPSLGIQSTILAYDVRRSEPNRVAAACLQLAESGRRQLGLAEMFTEN